MKHKKVTKTTAGIVRSEVIQMIRKNGYKAADMHSCYPYELCKVNKNSIYGTVNGEV